MTILTLVEHFPYPGLFALLILGGIGLPFPEDATLILCGFLISVQVVKPVPALFVVFAGILIADFVLYLAGRKYGRMIVTHNRFQRLLTPERLSALEGTFMKKGIYLILVGRHVMGLRAQILLVSGVLKMPPLKFLIADGVSSIFTVALMVGVGYMGGNSAQVLKSDVTRIEHIVFLTLLIAFVSFLFYRYFSFKKDRKGE